MKEYFSFGKQLEVFVDDQAANSTLQELWDGFCFHCSVLTFRKGQSCQFYTEKMESPQISQGKEYKVSVTPKGIAISAIDQGSLIRAIMVLMMHIEPVDLTEGKEKFRIECFCLESDYKLKNRMLHLCVFPETSTAELRKYIRLAGVLQYTHIVLEFWGTLRYDCLKELSWKDACSKEEIKSIVSEIEKLGMEAIPMFNHLGHASGCRISSGKHVVLDQNPKLATLFTPDGWSWDITNSEVPWLFGQIRKELYEIFDHTPYIHLGCDEVYSYEGEEGQKVMQKYLQDLTEMVINEGRRPIIWGDMLLNRESCAVDHSYYCNCENAEYAESLIKAVAPETVIVDWQYDSKERPVKTSLYLKKYGFEVLGAPWFDPENCNCHIDTACSHETSGIMLTTWHTIRDHLPMLTVVGKLSGAYIYPQTNLSDTQIFPVTATLLRKVCFSQGDYQNSGWRKQLP